MTNRFNFANVLINLDDYELNRIIGEGGFGVVFEAKDKKTGKLVALKVIRLDESCVRSKRKYNSRTHCSI